MVDSGNWPFVFLNSRPGTLIIEFAQLKRIEGKTLSEKTFVNSLLLLLAQYGISHPTRYKNVRQFIVRYQLADHMPELVKSAREIRLKLLYGFRHWLGENQPVAVDVETGEDKHLLTSDIDFTLRNDIERERITSSWRGYRHLFICPNIVGEQDRWRSYRCSNDGTISYW